MRPLHAGTLALCAIAGATAVASAQPRPPRPLREVIRLGPVVLALGKEEEDGPELFGNVISVALDGAGRIYVLDNSDATIRIFDSRGRSVEVTGKRGSGPGDMQNPFALLHDQRATLLLADNVLGVTRFRTDSTGVTISRTLARDLRPSAVCLLNDTLIAAGPQDDGIVHVIGADGNTLRSIGTTFAAESIPVLQKMAKRMAAFRMVCDARRSNAIVIELVGPGIRAYRMDGTVVWSLRLPGYDGSWFARDGRSGSPTVILGKDATAFAAQLSDDRMLVQVVRTRTTPGDRSTGRRGRREEDHRTTYIVDLATGVIVAEGSDLPAIQAIAGDRIVTGSSDPFPHIQVRTLTLLP